MSRPMTRCKILSLSLSVPLSCVHAVSCQIENSFALLRLCAKYRLFLSFFQSNFSDLLSLRDAENLLVLPAVRDALNSEFFMLSRWLGKSWGSAFHRGRVPSLLLKASLSVSILMFSGCRKVPSHFLESTLLPSGIRKSEILFLVRIDVVLCGAIDFEPIGKGCQKMTDGNILLRTPR